MAVPPSHTMSCVATLLIVYGLASQRKNGCPTPSSFSLHKQIHNTHVMLLVLDDVLRAMKNILILFQSGFSQTADYRASMPNFTKSLGHALLINPFEALYRGKMLVCNVFCRSRRGSRVSQKMTKS